jgi:hypothetical protein
MKTDDLRDRKLRSAIGALIVLGLVTVASVPANAVDYEFDVEVSYTAASCDYEGYNEGPPTWSPSSFTLSVNMGSPAVGTSITVSRSDSVTVSVDPNFEDGAECDTSNEDFPTVVTLSPDGNVAFGVGTPGPWSQTGPCTEPCNPSSYIGMPLTTELTISSTATSQTVRATASLVWTPGENGSQ